MKFEINETAYLEYRPLDMVYDTPSSATRGYAPILLILPGGSYTSLSDHEAYPIANEARAAGMHAAILRYTVLTERIVELEDLLQEVEQALDYLQERAEEDHIDMSRVIILGFSAGGHLAAWASQRFKDRLYRSVLCYPAVHMQLQNLTALNGADVEQIAADAGENLQTVRQMGKLFLQWPEKEITSESIPTFIFHSQNDPVVDVRGTLLYYLKLLEAQVPAAIHIFMTGYHGNGMGRWDDPPHFHQYNNELQAWWPLMMTWLNTEPQALGKPSETLFRLLMESAGLALRAEHDWRVWRNRGNGEGEVSEGEIAAESED